MKLIKHHSLALADKVLGHLRKEAATIPGEDIHIGAWSNCREQGYHLSSNRIFGSLRSLCVNIAECRGSDQVIVQTGTSDDFDGQSHQGNDKVYDEQKYFDSPLAAAKFIVDFFVNSPLRKGLSKDTAVARYVAGGLGEENDFCPSDNG
jgi:hypothetical protein